MQIFRLKSLPVVFWCILYLAFRLPVHAQHENIWAFGDKAGIDFNTDPPTAIQTKIQTTEGSASVCDENGQLLFYTDGTYVWDRNHNLMPNGSDLTDVGNITLSTTQGTVITPVPGSQDEYYVFSLGQFINSFNNSPYLGRLSYSRINMNLNDGLGDVTTKGILLDSLLTEHMTAVSGSDCNIWLIVVSRLNNNFKAYNIHADGVNPNPVISPGVPQRKLETFSEISGTIDIAPDRSKLAIAQNNVTLYDFDTGSGKITHPVLLHPITPAVVLSTLFYGLCFSPDNTKVYASLSDGTLTESIGLYQYDLNSGDSATMISSKTLISGLLTSAIKRAPNGKLYAVGAQGSGGGVALHVVNRPNLAGAACDFVPHGFALAQRTYTYFGLPNLSTVFYPKKIYSTITDSTLCSGPRTLSAGDLSGRNYVWGDSALGPTRVVDSPGTYWVRYQVPVNTPCKYENHVDTFKVGFRFTTTTIFTTTINSGRCQADTLVIQATNLKGINYLWQDDITGQQRKINKAGIYWISYEIDSLCEHHIDSFIITYPEKDYKVSFHTDTLVCQNEPVLFRNTSAIHFNNFSWHFGEGSGSGVDHPQYVYSHPGSYRVMLIGSIDGVCPDTAYQAIVVDQTIPTHFLTDRNNICAGEAIIFTTQTDSTLKAMSWKFGDGAKTISEKEKIHHTYETAGIMPVVLTTAYRACPESSFTDTVYVYRPPDVYLGSDTAFCLNGAPILLKNLEAPPTGAYRNLWNTGATTASINVVQPGAYSLTVSTEPLGCSTTESVIINKDCYIAIPNAFTPNDDGRNDYFFPRQLLSAHITGFKMRLFNRWGQTVFETASINGRGWDGRLNGNNQPEGVYTYFIDVEIDETRKERYQGNVTLMR